MTKTFQVEQKGKLTWRVVRQSPSDPQYKIGSRIPGLGKVVAVAGDNAPHAKVAHGHCPFCGHYGSDCIGTPEVK